MMGLKANDLIAQEYDKRGNLWATRGMVIYKLSKGDRQFFRIAHVSSGLSVFWLNNFSMIRNWTQKKECMEIIVSAEGEICVFSGGYMLYGNTNNKNFEKKMKLPQFGIGVGRGMMSTGLLNADDNLTFFGEYFRNEERIKVKIYRSTDFGQNWEVAFEFSSGTIRHIHSLQRDPYTGKLWICTGDTDDESMIGWSDDHFKNIHFIGRGTQTWRSCQLIFTEEAVYWGTDSGSEDLGGIYCWDKETMRLKKLLKVDGALFFGTRLEKGTMVMSTDREGFPNEKDDSTRLYIITNHNQVREIVCGTWLHKRHGLRFSFAKTRFQRNQGSNYLVLNFLNQKEISGGDLIMISESELNNSPSDPIRIGMFEIGNTQCTLTGQS
ncbi:MAG: hypothetical protein JEZ14_15345 [Marinilabiliaceae bacterium]|nr:hypothetical protein [Marinilabiliaceae bacterium]